MKRRMAKASLKTPALTYELIPRESEIGRPIYEQLETLLRQHHKELTNNGVRIALAWCTSWRPDVDGRVTIGKCRKATALDRELAPVDFVILLNKDFWQNLRVTAAQRLAVLDHECMHAAVAYDKETGEPKVDGRGRTMFRIRRHDLEEFRDIVARHGTYRVDIEEFVAAARRAEMKASTWVGYTSLSRMLASLGLVVAPTALAALSEAARQEIQTWVELCKEADVTKVNPAISSTLPSSLAALVQPEPPASAASH